MRLPGVKQTRNKKQETGNRKRGIRFKFGFSLIELLIVISLFGLSASMITAAYLTFERKQKIKNAAIDLKNNIRLTQSKAHSGDKGENKNCGFLGETKSSTKLNGWYINFNEGSNEYAIRAYCEDPSINITPIDSPINKTVRLSEGLQVLDLGYYETDPNAPTGIIGSVNVLFQPLTNDARFYIADPPFLDANGDDLPSRRGSSTSILRITLESDSGDVYYVDIASSGDINESK